MVVSVLSFARYFSFLIFQTAFHERHPSLTEGEIKHLCTGREKFDLEVPIRDGVRLANQLVKAGLGEHAVARAVDIKAMSKSGRLPIDRHAETHRNARRRSHDQVKIAGLKAIGNSPSRLVQDGCLSADAPVSLQCPMVELQL
jgi:hypothetical protein